MKKILIKLIEFYQKTLSPDHGFLKKFYPYGYCRFYPSCSEYTKKVIEKQGALLGIFSGFWRINRCNPFSKPGEDLPQKVTSKQSLYGFLLMLIYLSIFFMLFLVLKQLF